MSVKITTLVENSLGEHLALRNEHGLSFLIENDTPHRQILFDTGQSGNFIHNAGLLNLDLALTDKIVLSHGHYDHSGGLQAYIETFGSNFELLVGTGFFTPKYGKNNGAWEYLGNNFDREYLAKKKIDPIFIKEDRKEISPGVYVLTNFPRTCEFEKPNKRFYTYNGREYEPDLFTDEVAMVLEIKAGLVVLLGCHPGLVNIIETVRSRFNRPIYCIIGGTHLVEADDVRLERTFQYLRSLNLPLLGISHCTGEKAREYLKTIEGRFFTNSTGTSVCFES